MSSETAILIAIGVALIFMAAGYGVFSGSIDIADGVLGNYSDNIDTDSDKIPTSLSVNQKEFSETEVYLVNWQAQLS
jgi:hypothetical protein